MDVLQKKSSIVKETRTAPGDLASIQPSPRRRGGGVAWNWGRRYQSSFLPLNVHHVYHPKLDMS